MSAPAGPREPNRTVAAEVEATSAGLSAGDGLVNAVAEAGGMPSMQVQVGKGADSPPFKELITDDEMKGYFKEVLDFIREDRAEVGDVVKSFLDMVLNEGDASGPTKEALCNLLRLKHETAANMTRVMDLMMRSKLKETNTFPRWLAATQHNEIKINPRRKLVEKLQKQVADRRTK